jgi:hypothetical protein
VEKGYLRDMANLVKKKDRKLPHYLRLHKGQMQHYVAEIHFLSQEVLTKAPSHHYMQYLLGYVCPDKRFFRLDYELQLSKKERKKERKKKKQPH